MTTFGVVFRPQNPPERLRSVARAADEAGLEQLWLWEDCFLESGIATAAAALAWTDRLAVGIGLLPVPLRNVAVLGMEAATLHRLFPNRVLLTLGHGVQEWMGQVGARVGSPLTLLREHVEALKALLAGETVTTSGRYRPARQGQAGLPAGGYDPNLRRCDRAQDARSRMRGRRRDPADGRHATAGGGRRQVNGQGHHGVGACGDRPRRRDAHGP